MPKLPILISEKEIITQEQPEQHQYQSQTLHSRGKLWLSYAGKEDTAGHRENRLFKGLTQGKKQPSLQHRHIQVACKSSSCAREAIWSWQHTAEYKLLFHSASSDQKAKRTQDRRQVDSA